jgi:hypothetical protein
MVMSDLQDRARRVLEANARKNFIQRARYPELAPVIHNPDGTISTHRMASGEADGRYYAYPTIVQDPRTKALRHLGGREAFDYAMRTGEHVAFPSAEEAEAFATGGYKQGRFWREQ